MRWRTVSSWRAIVAVFAAGGLLAVCVAEQPADRAATAAAAPPRAAMKEFVSQFCTDCHNGKDKAGELELDAIAADDLSEHAAAWEKVVRKLDSRQMPPLDVPRPKEETYVSTLSALETALDAAAAAHPNPGRTPALHRLNRTEYQNAIRDLLALQIDTTDLLPRDEASHGFDNVLPGELSPTLLDRYITAAQKISHLAIGTSQRSASSDTIRIRADLTQEEQVEGLAIRDPRRRIDSVHLSAGRQIRHSDLARPRSERACRGLGRGASPGSAAGPRENGVAHRHAAGR